MSTPLLARLSAAPEAANLAPELEAALRPGQTALLNAVAGYAEESNAALYLVGGYVRDLLLGAPSSDFDLVVEGDAIQLAGAMAADLGGKVVAHKRFGTANWYLESVLGKLAKDFGVDEESLPDNLDLVSARQESYAGSGALPDVELAALDRDLYRRDFTINAMAVRLDGERRGELVDKWGGLKDLEQGVLRVLHSASFVDDPTRILRAVRFAHRFEFEIEQETLDLMKSGLDKLDNVSGERLLHEFEAIFKEEQRIAIVERLEELGVLAAIHHGLRFDEPMGAVLQNASAGAEGQIELDAVHFDMLLWLMQLSSENLEGIAERLKLPKALWQAALAASQTLPELDRLPASRPSEVTARFDRLPEDAVRALQAAANQKQRAVLQRYLAEWRGLRPGIDGQELKARGLAPGPRYAEILGRLRAAWLDGEVASEEQEQALLDRMLAEDGDD